MLLGYELTNYQWLHLSGTQGTTTVGLVSNVSFKSCENSSPEHCVIQFMLFQNKESDKFNVNNNDNIGTSPTVS